MAKKLGSCECRFGGLRQVFPSGTWELTLQIPAESTQAVKRLADAAAGLDLLTLTLAKYTRKRSLDANAYFWTLAGKLAAMLGISPEEVYRQCIREIGDNYEIVPIREDAKQRWIENWQSRGLGWICEDLGEGKIAGYSNVMSFYGSSTYDTAQMSRLIDRIVEECRAQGIETLPPEKLEAMKIEWQKDEAR